MGFPLGGRGATVSRNAPLPSNNPLAASGACSARGPGNARGLRSCISSGLGSSGRGLMLTSRHALAYINPPLARPTRCTSWGTTTLLSPPRASPLRLPLRTPKPSTTPPGLLRAAQDASAFGLAPAIELDHDRYEDEQQQRSEAQSFSSTTYSITPEAWGFVQAQASQLALNYPPRQQTPALPPATASPVPTAPLQTAETDLLQAPIGQRQPGSPLFPPLPSTSTPSTPAASSPAPISLVAWGALLLLSLSYMHQACNSFSLPVMFPAVSAELGLDDFQGALLTSGYSYLYALALLPVGLLCDRLPRPKLLAAGVASWSALTLLAASAHNFGELMAARIGFAAAQAVQNPISFALIPELFPNNKSMAVSIYNCSVYLGRALSYGAALAGEELSRLGKSVTAVAAAATGSNAAAALTPTLTPAEGAASLIFVPLDKLDLRLVSIVYTRGDYAAVMPHFGYTTMGSAMENLELMDPASRGSEAVSAVMTAAGETGWRDVLRWVAAPGFLIALAIVLALPEPRDKAPEQGAATAKAKGQQQQDKAKHAEATAASFLMLLRSPAFMCTTLAASFNDVASYALMAWQSTFYERVYSLEPAQYAPMLAAVLPIGGIIGGVGGGWLADRAAGARNGSRVWVTAGASAVAAPVLLLSMLAGDANESFLALMVGFSLSEAWRAPGANMARSVAPPEMGSSASALYLCIRNLVGGMGPIGVTFLTQHLGGDLRQGMLLVPAMYLASGAMFFIAEQQFARLDGSGPPSSGINQTSAI